VQDKPSSPSQGAEYSAKARSRAPSTLMARMWSVQLQSEYAPVRRSSRG
jgi:hypothetical protein